MMRSRITAFLQHELKISHHICSSPLISTKLPRVLLIKPHFQRRFVSNPAASSISEQSIPSAPAQVEISGKTYLTDTMTNLSSRVLTKVDTQLHRQHHHPLNSIKLWVEQSFQSLYDGYKVMDSMCPVVSTKQNFDDLLFTPDHPGRNVTDTYYVNSTHVLRTHTSAHQSEVLSTKSSDGYLLTADVYRRDEIDPTHYPVFHQMEGIRLFRRDQILADALKDKFAQSLKDKLCTPIPLSKDNPGQGAHSNEEIVIIGHHLRSSLEHMIRQVFSHAPDLKIRWVETYFPFTQPSWEAEIWYNEKWLEICGCGIIRQEILDASGNRDHVGWAFGIGLERLAMVLYEIPDIRLFWSQDSRFLNQFQSQVLSKFTPFSKYPICYKDVSFWCNSDFHENDFMEIAGEIAGDLVEEVKLIDSFVHPKTKRNSRCYRLNYRSMERTLTNAEVDALQNTLREKIAERLPIELRS